MHSPPAIALTPILMVVALLWWETTSPIGLTFGKQRHDGKALSAATLTTAEHAAATSHQAQSDAQRALIASGIFSRTSPEVVTALSKELHPERFSSGRVMGAQSDFGGYVYVIIAGKVKVSCQRYGGGEIVLKILGPSEIFGAITLFDPGPQDMRMTTLTEVLAVPIARDQLLTWVVERPEVCDQVLRLFARWVKAMTNSLVDFGFADAQGRIASRLLLLRKRFGQQEGDAVRVVHDLTADEFSQLAGVDPETIGATLRGFEANGWIRLEDDSIVIVDGHALSQLRQVSMGEVCDV
ncbi:Crp/Fnr family transcriptional regulator [Mycobacterium sp. Aquia_213]|uniref:Crp/Fnr family transcriptional regulator n=1 Tax=Mycobacterium sp. Aquia_213 TaxID=2991728 RepID=UPI002270D635|nr:Crp/Fnr family transcriptional regulator [Mycobacterium sp. Aquia_213]WAC90502.1 Crp/Fnr family transcriptional regulator [Mycobacterium sp. Aquia_213]